MLFVVCDMHVHSVSLLHFRPEGMYILKEWLEGGILWCGDDRGALCHPYSAFLAAEQVLAQLQDQFFHEMDTASIILDLVHWSIIDGCDVAAITTEDDQRCLDAALHS